MADFDFSVTSGPYEGRYQVDLADLNGVDSRDFRGAIGISLAEVVGNGGGDLDTLAALVWLTRRKSNKALPFQAVAEHINYGNVEQTAADADPVEPDPTTPGDG